MKNKLRWLALITGIGGLVLLMNYSVLFLAKRDSDMPTVAINRRPPRPQYDNIEEVKQSQSAQICIKPEQKFSLQDVIEPTSGSRVLSASVRVRKRFPQAMIIGAAKAGTKALRVMLDLHPQIVTGPKEIGFFSKEEKFVNGLQWYLEQMPFSRPTEITIEKTPQLTSECAPERIKYFFPHVKLILIVRDPIDRAISHYLQQIVSGEVSSATSFEENALDEKGALDSSYHPINQSAYDYHMRRWLTYFPLEQIHIVNGDKFAKRTRPPSL